MNLIDVPLPGGSFPRRLTCADLAALPSELPSGPVDYELDNGRLVIMSPTSDPHAAIQSNFSAYLKLFGEWRGHGRARTEGGVILWRNPDRLVGPDAAFVANRSLPLRRSPEGYLETIPDIVVEIRSKNDSAPEVDQKVQDYLKAGVRLLWIADPQTRSIAVHRPDRSVQVLNEADALTALDIIPDFSVSVADLFRE